MKIYKLKFLVDDYDNIVPQTPYKVDDYKQFNGQKLLNNWKTLKVKRMEPEKN